MTIGRYRTRHIEGVPATVAELDFSTGSPGDVLFAFGVKHQKIEVIGIGFDTDTTSGGAIVAGQEALFALRKTERVTGTVTNYTDLSQLVPYPAAGILPPDGIMGLLDANVAPSVGADINLPPNFPEAVRGDRIEIIANQLATGGTQTGRVFLMYRELGEGTPQEGPT